MSTTIAARLTEAVAAATAKAGFADAGVPAESAVPTADARHGDYQSNHAFRVAKALKKNPREVATAVAAALENDGTWSRVEVAGPGFLNFTLDDAFLARDLASRAGDPRLGAPDVGQGRVIVLDYSSPNIAKRMHVGHLRSTVIGAALHGIQAFLGWKVLADNHVGDWGTPFGKLIVAWSEWRDEAAYAEDAIAELQRLYQLFGEKAKEDPALDARARAETAKLQAGDPTNRALWADFCAKSLAEFESVYARFGIRFDMVRGESFYEPALKPLVDDLLARGIAIENDGAVIVPLDPPLDSTPLLIRKSDGAALYGTTDLATVARKVADFQPAIAAYVTDTRQQLHFKQFFAASRKAGIAPPALELVHIWFGMLRFADGALASTRAGAVINLVDVLDTAAARARQLVDEKSSSLPEAERAAISEAVGVGAVRYADLSQNPQTDIVFEWNKMLAMDGNTAPYLMYAHARCRSILRRAAEQGIAPGPVQITDPAERSLILAIARTPEAIVAAGAGWRPNVLCEHLFSLSQTLSSFYANVRVLDEGTAPEIVASRLTLVEATANALRTGLSIIGLTPLERM